MICTPPSPSRISLPADEVFGLICRSYCQREDYKEIDVKVEERIEQGKELLLYSDYEDNCSIEKIHK